MTPDWSSAEKNKLSNSTFFLPWVKTMFPGYVDHPDHPFGYCNALTHVINGEVSPLWASFDSPQLFNKNLKTMPWDWKYRSQGVRYVVNSSGFRTHEWQDIDWQNAIVILGCSNTFGVGLHETETISSVLHQLTGRQVVNLGYPAGSNEQILNMGSTLFEKFGVPYSVIVNWTTTDRMKYYERFSSVDVGPWNNTTKIINDMPSKLYNIMVADDYNLQTRNYFISRAMNAIWHGRTKYITLSFFDMSAHYMLADAAFKIDNKARDCLHPGYENSKEVANYINNRLKEI